MRILNNGRLIAMVVLVACSCQNLSAADADAKPEKEKSKEYTFRNQLSLNTGDLQKDWSMVEGKSDQDTVASFILSEDGEEKALVGISRMDDIFTNPDRMKLVAKDQQAMLKKLTKGENKLTITEDVKISTKSGDYTAIKLDFEEKLDGKKVSIYLLCIPAGKDAWHAYGIQVSLSDDADATDVDKLLKVVAFKPKAKPVE